jgi:hypothetical protein
MPNHCHLLRHGTDHMPRGSPASLLCASARADGSDRRNSSDAKQQQNHKTTNARRWQAPACTRAQTAKKGRHSVPQELPFIILHTVPFRILHTPIVPSILCLPVAVPAHARTRTCTLQQRLDAADTRFQSSEARLDAKTKWARQLEAERDALETSKREVEVRYSPPPWRK